MEKKDNKKRIILLDAHAIIHRAYHALPSFYSQSGEPTGAVYGLSSMLIKIIKDLEPDYVLACFDLPKETFRHSVYENYKANRVASDNELVEQIKSAYKIFDAFKIPIYCKEGYEADDILGTAVEQLSKKKDLEIIIASGDLDTLQLVEGNQVKVFTLKKGITDTFTYNQKAVEERFGFAPKFLPDYKGLSGDPSDNIIGISGIGEKTAKNLVSKFGSLDNIYKELKKDKGAFKQNSGLTDRMIGLLEAGEDEARFSKTLATILKDAPVSIKIPAKTFFENFDDKQVEDVFDHFGFRSLIQRLPKKEKEENHKPETIDPKELKETAVALWLLDSENSNPSLDDILAFAGTSKFQDAKSYILKKIKEEGLEDVYYLIELPILEDVEQMREKGVLLDLKHLEKLKAELEKKIKEIKKQIYALSEQEFNLNSPKQVSEVLFSKLNLKSTGIKKTKSGVYSTKESELIKIQGQHKIIDYILTFRELQKIYTGYVDALPKQVDKENRLHSHVLQTGTTTGRFSSQDPNLQNIPVRSDYGKKIRKAFIAPNGYSFLAMDYSQIELRITAILSDDEKLLDIFSKDQDVHTSVAAEVFNVSKTEVDKEMRRKAKVINFGIIYGMGIRALQKNLSVSQKEAEDFLSAYKERFSGVMSYLEEIKKQAHKNGFTKTLFGRKRYFPAINSSADYIRSSAERMAVNAPIQGTSADVIKLAIKHSRLALKEAGLDDDASLILQIHDELIYEVKTKKLKEVAKVVKQSMEDVLKDSFLKMETEVPLKVNASFGPNWGELKEI